MNNEDDIFEEEGFDEAQEIWKPIIGWEGLYEVSNLGRVKSLSRIVNNYSGSGRRIKEIILKNIKNHYGYINVMLRNKNSKIFRVHRLVAQAFIPNPKNKPQVNHKNGIKTDNRVENLEWVTCSENNLHAFKTGLRNTIKSNKKVIQIKNGKNIKIWKSLSEASRGLNINVQNISACCLNKRKLAGGFSWRFFKNYDNSLLGMINGLANPKIQTSFDRGCERSDEDNGDDFALAEAEGRNAFNLTGQLN